MTETTNVSIDFFKDYSLADLGPHAQLLYIGLKCIENKLGCIEDKPRRIKAEIFPYYEVDVNRELDILCEHGFIDRDDIDDRAIITVLDL